MAKNCTCHKPGEFTLTVVTTESVFGFIGKDGLLHITDDADMEDTNIQRAACNTCGKYFPISKLPEHKWE
jgi:hypothetical protein